MRRRGARDFARRRVAGRECDLRARARTALTDEQTDLLITIGGTGAGRNDASVAMLERMGDVAIHGFGIAPGETAALGIARGHTRC